MDIPTAPHSITLSPDDVELLLDGLQALEYWEYATELDLPRRNGQVFLPEDDPTCWRRTTVGDDEAVAIEQIRRIRALTVRVSGADDR